jgi:hypothetical protein
MTQGLNPQVNRAPIAAQRRHAHVQSWSGTTARHRRLRRLRSTDPGAERVWFHWVYRLGGWAVCAYFYLSLVTDSLADPPAETWPLLPVNVLTAVLVSRGLAFPEIRTRREEVVVQGALHTWRIPYRRVASARMDSAVTIKTTTGQEIDAIAFQGSIVGLLTGEKKAQRLVATITERASCSDASPDETDARRSLAPALRQTACVVGVYTLTYAVIVAVTSWP